MKTIKCPICHKQAEQSSHWDDVYNCGVDEKYFGLPHYTMDLKDEVYSIVIDGCSVSCLIKENITIIDNGPGLTRKALRQIFTPFYSTKPIGNGLGLSTAQDILNHELHATLTARCRVGKGTTFFISGESLRKSRNTLPSLNARLIY